MDRWIRFIFWYWKIIFVGSIILTYSHSDINAHSGWGASWSSELQWRNNISWLFAKFCLSEHWGMFPIKLTIWGVYPTLSETHIDLYMPAGLLESIWKPSDETKSFITGGPPCSCLCRSAVGAFLPKVLLDLLGITQRLKTITLCTSFPPSIKVPPKNQRVSPYLFC